MTRWPGTTIDPLGPNEIHLSCRISSTHVAAIWRPSLYTNSIAAGVKVHHNTHTMPYLSEKKYYYLSHQ